jgi:hypothetical protein
MTEKWFFLLFRHCQNSQFPKKSLYKAGMMIKTLTTPLDWGGIGKEKEHEFTHP